MVHVFKYKEYNYIYDSGSGSLHECDDKTYDYLAYKLGESSAKPALSEAEIASIEGDLKALEDEGLLFKEEVKTHPAKSNEVKALCIHICHDCNLRCRYCFADEGAYHSSREFMSEETAKKAIDFLISNSGNRKVLEVDFFGGEPLMCLQTIKNVVAYARAEAAKVGKKFLFTTTTNALLLNDDAIEFFNAEMENVVLSLDGRKEVHDAIRKTVNGKGSFDYVIGKYDKQKAKDALSILERLSAESNAYASLALAELYSSGNSKNASFIAANMPVDFNAEKARLYASEAVRQSEEVAWTAQALRILGDLFLLKTSLPKYFPLVLECFNCGTAYSFDKNEIDRLFQEGK